MGVREALPYLEHAVNTCMLYDEPVEHIRASLHLGQARAALGDEAGACAAYATVIERSGAATPPWRSTATAREQRAALGCIR